MTQRIPPDLWTDARHRDGLEAERLAADWLVARGWRVLEQRYRLGRHDLDLVVRRGVVVAFVEVKWRQGAGYGSGVEAVGPRKRRVIEQVAWAWILRRGEAADQYRFDVLSLSGPLERCRFTHVEDAWRPGWR
jgi:putative endonuclease